MTNRTICWFSCGAASAVATKLALAEYDNVVIAYAEVKEEHPDNKRFLKDCENWFGKEILILKNEKYDGSVINVIKQRKYIVGNAGAPCTLHLKKNVREKFQLPTDIHVFGYTIEEMHRVDRFIDANNNVNTLFPLIEKQLTKTDCLAMLNNAGIELPAMYRLGYKNNNCIGCVKGGMGYWNKIKKDFPNEFQRMCEMEEYVGATLFNGMMLRDLPEGAGRYEAEEDIQCGIFCLMAEQVYS